MPLELTPLSEAQLSPAARKVVSSSAPPQLQLMAARGLAPLPPGDLVQALYQFAVSAEGALADTARASAGGLPEAVLAAVLGSRLDARVIDFFARALVRRPKPLHAILLNPL